MHLRLLLYALVVGLIGLLGPRVALGTVLVPMSDVDLVSSSSFIVTAEVDWIESVELDGGRIATRITLEVERAVKGNITGDTIVVTEPGGRVGGRTVRIFGAPEYAVGERVLVFLWRVHDGTLRTNGLALGKYHIAAGTLGSELALRAAPTLEVRRLDQFMAKLGTLAGGRSPDTYVPSENEAPDEKIRGLLAVERFTFLGDPPARWFEPDSGKPVGFLLANSDATLGSQETKAVVADSLAAWTNVSTASIVLENAGNSSPAESLTQYGTCDDRSKIQFNDPFDEMPDLNLIHCTGVFAVGGFCARAVTKKLAGTRFDRIVEADVTVNANIGACVSRIDITETVAHEIGHTIGLGHSSDTDALMYQFAHHDGRGARLNDDDVLGVSTMYPELDDDGDGIPDARDRCPLTPPGFIVDAEGCACTEPGSAGCDDGDLCTEDSCNTMTGACVNNAVDCDDGEPCTFDCCDPVTGACINDLDDSDGDGVCDMMDNCPLQADADPTDLNGDGVGDVCQCADERPGRCVPGRGWKERRCILEWLPAVTPGISSKGFPSVQLRCIDGDPACDEDDLSGQCTFRVALCVDNDDPRLPACEPSTVDDLVIKSPKRNRPKDAADVANAEVLGAAIEAIGPSGPGPHGCGRAPAVRCSEMLPIVVPTRGQRSGSKSLKVKGMTDKGLRAKARLKLICKPADR
jgi:Matrixin/Dictyostelium (slime mold) repeat